MPEDTSTPSPRAVADPLDLPRVTVLVGHAGVGKTNCALGLSLAAAARGRDVTLADLDTVNPYFRSSDYAGWLGAHGVRVSAPRFAGTTLDTPSLTGELDAIIGRAATEPGACLVIDCGGDDDGATTLGRYAGALRAAGARVLYAVSAYRSLTPEPADAAAMLPAIEANSHLHADAVLNTSNLAGETTPGHVRRGRAFAADLCRLLGVPLAATAVPAVAVRRAADADPGAGPEARALLAREGGVPMARPIDPISSPHVAALLTDGEHSCEPLVVMPRFVGTPWDAGGLPS